MRVLGALPTFLTFRNPLVGFAVLVVLIVGAAAYRDYVLNADFCLFLGILYGIRLFPKAYEGIQTRVAARTA